jgi:hypothetical protein
MAFSQPKEVLPEIAKPAVASGTAQAMNTLQGAVMDARQPVPTPKGPSLAEQFIQATDRLPTLIGGEVAVPTPPKAETLSPARSKNSNDEIRDKAGALVALNFSNPYAKELDKEFDRKLVAAGV